MDDEKLKGWLLPYFEKVCRKVFDGYMRQHGFKKSRLNSDVSLYYFHENTYLNIGYDIMDRPRYPLHIGIGFGFEKERYFEGIGLWYTIPEYEKLDHSFWYFSNEIELERNLTRVRDEIIDVYAKPLWENVLNLEKFVASWNKERKEAEEKEFLQNKKIEGENAFKKGNFQKTIKIYNEIGLANLSAVELKRLALAKKHIK